MTSGYHPDPIWLAVGSLPVTPVQLIAVGVVLSTVGADGAGTSRARAGRGRGPTVAHRREGQPCADVYGHDGWGDHRWAVGGVQPDRPDRVWAPVWLVLLGVPAFLAAATVTRLLALVRIARSRRS